MHSANHPCAFTWWGSVSLVCSSTTSCCVCRSHTLCASRCAGVRRFTDGRQAFAERYKSHRSYDILLLCPNCHEKAATTKTGLIEQIVRETGIPVLRLYAVLAHTVCVCVCVCVRASMRPCWGKNKATTQTAHIIVAGVVTSRFCCRTRAAACEPARFVLPG